MFQEYRARTEFSLAYTIMTMEDVIFVDETKLVSLEYIFYQGDGAYSSLQETEYIEGEQKLGRARLGPSCESHCNKAHAEHFENDPKYFKVQAASTDTIGGKLLSPRKIDLMKSSGLARTDTDRPS